MDDIKKATVRYAGYVGREDDHVLHVFADGSAMEEYGWDKAIPPDKVGKTQY